MRKIYKLLLTLVMLVAGVGAANAQGETDITTLPWVQKGQNCEKDFNDADGGTVFGTDAGGTNLSYVDVSDYGIIKLYGPAGQRARLFINREEAGDPNGIFFVDLNEEGVATFDCNTVLTQQPKAQYIHLNGVKASAWNTKLNLSSITVSGSAITFPEPDPFVLPDGEVEINTLPWVNEGQACANNLGTKTASPIYGTDAGPAEGKLSYIDATDYSAVKLYGPDGTVRLFINRAEYAEGTFQFFVTIADGVGTLDFSDVYAAQEGATYIHINGVKASSPGAEAQVNHITLVEKQYIEATAAVAAPAGTTDLNGMTGAGDIKWNISYPQVVESETLWGGNIDGDNQSVDITDYDYLHFVVSSASADAHTGLRVFVSTEQSDNNDHRICLYPHPIAEYAEVTNWEEKSWITEPGVYVVKISDYPLLRGIKALQAWAENAGKISVAMAYVSKGAPVAYLPSGLYTLVGEATGSASLEAALNDDDATCYDATGVTGTDVDLTSVANPNALFIAKDADVLANTENVIVNDVCDDLFLTDGFAFKAPADFTAAHVTYKRALAGKTVTVCLPFALNSDQVANIGTFYALSNFDGSTLQFTSVDATEANTPYVVVASSYSLGLDGADVAVPATPASLAASASDVEFIGTMAETTVPASNATYSYYAYNNGEFVKVVNAAATLPAFRGYFKVANGGAGSRALNVSFEDAATGIETLSTVENETKSNTIFDLSGRRVNAAQKGVYIVNGKKVIK